MAVPGDDATFTILGAGGFIGGTLAASLRRQGWRVQAVTRASLPLLLAGQRHAGHVIDCIGLTADFRSRPLETAEAHVGLVARCLAELRFSSFLLLSSTRVYSRAGATREDAAVPILATDPSDLYNVTKLAGEALCLSDPRAGSRVVRLSNVFGIGMPDTAFLGQVLREGRASGTARFCQSPESAKDYISIAAVLRLLPAIAMSGQHRLYNVATGRNTSHGAIAARCTKSPAGRSPFAPNAPTVQ
ncbi:MAG: NAD-dependent epimerase/dehydratase family protein [Acetobacteraceae bacterium]